MARYARVTVTLPADVLADIDRLEHNRSRFVLEAVEHELRRRRRSQLKRSLRHPHPETAHLAHAGLAAWASGLPAEDASDLVDPAPAGLTAYIFRREAFGRLVKAADDQEIHHGQAR